MVVGLLENYLGMYLKNMEPPCWFLKVKSLFIRFKKKKTPDEILQTGLYLLPSINSKTYNLERFLKLKTVSLFFLSLKFMSVFEETVSFKSMCASG